MVNKLVDDFDLCSVYAETDKDAVGFYYNNKFEITQFKEDCDGETVIRYRCELTK